MNSASQSAPVAAEPAAPVKDTKKRTIQIDARPRVTRDQITELFLHELSHTERLLAILWYVERMTPEEIALTIDSTPALVKLSHSRILQKLG